MASLATEQESVRFALWTEGGGETGGEKKWFSADIQFPPAPSFKHSAAPSLRNTWWDQAQCYRREVIQEKTNLLTCSVNWSRSTLSRGSPFNTSCSEASCWRAEGWGRSVGRRRETDTRLLKHRAPSLMQPCSQSSASSSCRHVLQQKSEAPGFASNWSQGRSATTLLNC